MTDSLGDRMKLYEAAWRPQFPPRMPIVVRVDGRAFHTFTRQFERPFSTAVMDAMDAATDAVAAKLQGCILAYTQSDEASFIIQTDRSLQSQMLWGGDLVKIVSTTAALMTASFNLARENSPHFDARAFVMPWDDVPNYILWRYRDWTKNSVTMQALEHFSHKQLHEKNTGQKLGMLQEIGHPWEALSPRIRHGHFYGFDLANIAQGNVERGVAALQYGDILNALTLLRFDADKEEA